MLVAGTPTPPTAVNVRMRARDAASTQRGCRDTTPTSGLGVADRLAVLSDPVVEAGVEHRNAGVDSTRERGDRVRFVATCTCGWRSLPVTTAGMAGSAFDEHRADPTRS